MEPSPSSSSSSPSSSSAPQRPPSRLPILKSRSQIPTPSKARAPLASTQTNNRFPVHSRAFSSASQDALFKKPASRPRSRLSSSGLSPKAALPTTPVARKPSRPSLSERTIESLAQIPPSPAVRRRKSSFFTQDSPMAPPSRPTSSVGYSSTSRPTSQDGAIPPMPLFAPRTAPPRHAHTMRATPTAAALSKRAVTTAARARSPTKSSLLKAADKEPSMSASTRATPRGSLRGTKTISGRIQQARPAVASLFAAPAPSTPKPAVRKQVKKPALLEEANPSPKAAQASKSSAALREQIRAAKAARASLGAQQPKPSAGPTFPGFDPGAHADPFNTQPKDGRSMIQKRVDVARTEGRLNIAAMNLKEIPLEVLTMYDSESNKDSEIPWNEVVHLVRFVAADNEIETIADDAFPDADPESWDEEVKGPQFGGLEVLDLHGNVLFDVPRGLKRLQCLTTLNLSRNRLMNDALETITQIGSLRELKIADNLLTGELTSIEQLHNLEVLDVSGNKLSLLPDEMRELSKLRILDVSNNQLTDLPMNELSKIQLVELHASKNRLSGSFFTTAGTTMSRLLSLDISMNAISKLYDGSAGPELPAMHTLNIAFNQISALPDMSTWLCLSTILAEDNKISELPLGFTESTSLKSVDLTGNDLTKLDERIALMDCLETLKIGGNSIRERKFLTMSMDEMKRDLRARMGPVSFME